MMIHFWLTELPTSCIMLLLVLIIVLSCQDSRIENQHRLAKHRFSQKTYNTANRRLIMIMIFTVITGMAMLSNLTVNNWHYNGPPAQHREDAARIIKIKTELPKAVTNAKTIDHLTYHSQQTDHQRAVQLVHAGQQKYQLMQLIGGLHSDTQRKLYGRLFDQVYHIPFHADHWN